MLEVGGMTLKLATDLEPVADQHGWKHRSRFFLGIGLSEGFAY